MSADIPSAWACSVALDGLLDGFVVRPGSKVGLLDSWCQLAWKVAY